MLEIGPKIKVAEWPEVWGKAYNFPKMCTSSLVVIGIPNCLGKDSALLTSLLKYQRMFP